MATFDQTTVGTDVTPDFGAQKKSQPQVRSARFGSGYEQRTQFGINQNPKTWDLTWTAQSNTAADAIEAFFDARAGVEAFDWTPLTTIRLISLFAGNGIGSINTQTSI